MQDIIGFIRVILPRYTEAGQRKAMDAHSIKVVSEGGKKSSATRADLFRMTRPGTVIAVQHLHLLADPRNKRKRGGMRADLYRSMDEIEKRGGIIWELYTGFRTDTREGRDAMTRAAVETLARGRHKTRMSDKRGRPPKTFTEAQIEKARAVWESRKLRRWKDVAERLPKGMTLKRAWQMFGPRNTEN